MRRIEKTEPVVFAHGATYRKIHTIELSDLIPDARFRLIFPTSVSEFTVLNGPYSEIPSKKIKINVVDNHGQGSRFVTDLGVMAYDSGYWNPSKLERTDE